MAVPTKLISTSQGFQDAKGNVVANGLLSLTLSQAAEVTASGGLVTTEPLYFVLDANGKITSTAIWFNDELTPSGTTYHAVLYASNQVRIITDFGQWSIAGASADLSTMVPTATNVSTANALLLNPGTGVTQTVSTGNVAITNNETVGGTFAVTGNVTETTGQNQYKAYSFNSVLWVDGIKYTTVMGAYADLPSTGGVVMVPPNYSETVAASWTLNKAYSAIVFTGPATMNFGSNTITVSVGIHGVTIESWIPWGSVVISDPSGVEFKYTGTGTFITVGASSADTYAFRMKDICVFTNNAGSAAIGIKVIRSTFHELRSMKFIGPTGAVTQQAIILDGTGNFTGGIIYSPIIAGYFKGIQFTGSGVNAGNTNEVIGGSISSPANGTSLGIDFEAGSSGNVIYGTDVENHAVGYNFGGTSQGNIVFGRSEGNTSGATFGASTLQNELHLIGSDPFTDSGTNNLVFSSGGTVHGASLQGVSGSNAITLLNSQDVVGPLTGNSADQTLFTYTLPGNTLAKGKGIRVKVWWIHGTGTASVTYKLFFGATAVINSASAVTGNGYAEAIIMNQPGVTTDQRASSQFSPTGTVAVIQAGLHPVEATTSNVVVKFTFNVANTDQVTGAQWVVELIQ